MEDDSTAGRVRSNDLLGLPPVGALTDGEVAMLRAWAQDYAAQQAAAEREHLREMTEGRDYYMQKSRTLKASQEALRTAARAAFVALRAEGTKHGRLCEMLDAALKA